MKILKLTHFILFSALVQGVIFSSGAMQLTWEESGSEDTHATGKSQATSGEDLNGDLSTQSPHGSDFTVMTMKDLVNEFKVQTGMDHPVENFSGINLDAGAGSKAPLSNNTVSPEIDFRRFKCKSQKVVSCVKWVECQRGSQAYGYYSEDDGSTWRSAAQSPISPPEMIKGKFLIQKFVTPSDPLFLEEETRQKFGGITHLMEASLPYSTLNSFLSDRTCSIISKRTAITDGVYVYCFETVFPPLSGRFDWILFVKPPLTERMDVYAYVHFASPLGKKFVKVSEKQPYTSRGWGNAMKDWVFWKENLMWRYVELIDHQPYLYDNDWWRTWVKNLPQGPGRLTVISFLQRHLESLIGKGQNTSRESRELDAKRLTKNTPFIFGNSPEFAPSDGFYQVVSSLRVSGSLIYVKPETEREGQRIETVMMRDMHLRMERQKNDDTVRTSFYARSGIAITLEANVELKKGFYILTRSSEDFSKMEWKPYPNGNQISATTSAPFQMRLEGAQEKPIDGSLRMETPLYKSMENVRYSPFITELFIEGYPLDREISSFINLLGELGHLHVLRVRNCIKDKEIFGKESPFFRQLERLMELEEFDFSGNVLNHASFAHLTTSLAKLPKLANLALSIPNRYNYKKARAFKLGTATSVVAGGVAIWLTGGLATPLVLGAAAAGGAVGSGLGAGVGPLNNKVKEEDSSGQCIECLLPLLKSESPLKNFTVLNVSRNQIGCDATVEALKKVRIDLQKAEINFVLHPKAVL